MKKFFKYMALVAVALVTSTAFTACDDDDDDNNGQQTTSTIKTWEWRASDAVSSTLTAYFDYETTVTLPNGETRPFSASFSESSTSSGMFFADSISYPATITMSTVRKLANGVTPTDDETVSGQEIFSLSVSGLDSKSLVVKGETAGDTTKIDALRVAAWASRYPNGQTIDTHTITIYKTSTGYTFSK